ncbi:MAG: adenosylmethionine--8-amino-7-oxononanoate transaminase [Nitrospirae bacterium]|nr:adenosylmethionine--8-amino-7-oxononanoate transaminase [Nitrospirota bacterium]
MNDDELVRLDHRHVWHPFTQMREWVEDAPVMIAEGSGVYLTDTRGRRHIDGISSMWCNIHGHRKRELDEAAKAQLDKICHSTLLGFASPPSIELAARLSAALPDGLTRVFYSDNGSTAVEVALKMAFQYWRHKGENSRTRFVSLNNAYHGDTLGAVAVGGIELFHEAFGPLLMKGFKAPSHYCYRCELGKDIRSCDLACAKRLETILARHEDEVAGVILEPLIQGAGGMITAPPGYLKRVADACRKYDTLLILDEVATGFGRTGRMFACEHESVTPDIICLSKGITGGYLPLAATVATDRIYNEFLGAFGELKTFFHGHTYTGNPLACAVALASLDLFESERIIERLAEKIEYFRMRLDAISAHRHVGEARSVGLMAGVELVAEKATRIPFPYEAKMGWAVCRKALELGLILRPLGNTIVLMPPLSITMEELAAMMDMFEASMAGTF